MQQEEVTARGVKPMSSLVKLCILVFCGIAAGIGFNEWSASLPATAGGGADLPLGRLDLFSYASGLVAGMILWQVGSVPWAQIPQRARQYVLSKTHVYQFVVISAACVAVLIYF